MSQEFGRELDPSQNQNRNLDQCPNCDGAFLQDDREELEEVGEGIWFRYLECADCGHGETRALTDEQIHDLNGVLDDRAHEVKAAADLMSKTTPAAMAGMIATSSTSTR